MHCLVVLIRRVVGMCVHFRQRLRQWHLVPALEADAFEGLEIVALHRLCLLLAHLPLPLVLSHVPLHDHNSLLCFAQRRLCGVSHPHLGAERPLLVRPVREGNVPGGLEEVAREGQRLRYQHRTSHVSRRGDDCEVPELALVGELLSEALGLGLDHFVHPLDHRIDHNLFVDRLLGASLDLQPVHLLLHFVDLVLEVRHRLFRLAVIAVLVRALPALDQHRPALAFYEDLEGLPMLLDLERNVRPLPEGHVVCHDLPLLEGLLAVAKDLEFDGRGVFALVQPHPLQRPHLVHVSGSLHRLR
mmetsp:Transcript_45477/g.103563  ORF Transcript_45477/g.103563 Transcript_45477/m.103563 type:complete len:301 (-) Transcript_45477:164-1066(-)